MLDKWKGNMSSVHLVNILAANVNCKKNTITCYISFEGIYNSISRIYKYIILGRAKGLFRLNTKLIFQ